ncbi:MAG: metallophosphoesterase [Elusimicrobia bacterium]|nr:metallophosphoesterase [Elusimicrobiota bacterium]
MSELAAAVAFIAAVVLLFYLEARQLVQGWRGARPLPRPLSLLLHAAAALAAACVLYGSLWEPSWIEVRTVRIASPRVAAGSGTIRIVHISDLHSEARAGNEPRAAALINGLQPDLVMVTGDYLNTQAGLPTARRLLQDLRSRYGVFCVTGNYDLLVPAPGLFSGLAAEHLDRRAAVLDVRGTKVRVIGLDLRSAPHFKRLMAALGPSGGYDVLLHHTSDLAYEAADSGIDLYLSGHTHGGQVRLPFYGALVTLATFGKRFESGLYRVGSTILYVNRGLGTEGGTAPRVRFLCRPEITVFELSAGP